MLADERAILESVRDKVLRILSGVELTVIHSSESPWTWSLRVTMDGGYPRQLFWGSNQWSATMRFLSVSGAPTTILEPIAAATEEEAAVDLGTVIACAAAGSVALDIVAFARASGPADTVPALEVFGAALAILEAMQRSDSLLDAPTRALASTLRAEWLVGRLDDLLG